MATQTQPAAPAEVWAHFVGDINTANTARLMAGLSMVASQGAGTVHLLLQSWGGFIGDGVFLYNAIGRIGLRICAYNAGHVASAATLAFLGAHRRKATANSTFMIHKGWTGVDRGGVERLKAVAGNLLADDMRMEQILKTHLRLPDELWTRFDSHDVFLPGIDAVQYGIADEIGDFNPPPGTVVLNAIGG